MPPEWRPALSAVHVTRVASAEECAWVVAEAEKHAAGGWNEAGHHDQYPTCDVVVAERLGLGVRGRVSNPNPNPNPNPPPHLKP